MMCNCLTKKLLCLFICCLAGLFALVGCRTPDQYKAESDQRVYTIIDRKWDKSFGTKANYKISDTEPSSNDIQIKRAVPASGILTLPRAVAIATAHNTQYQIERENLYNIALDLRLIRHDFEPKFFGTTFTGYTKRAGQQGEERLDAQASFGFDQLLATGAVISTNVTAAWIDILTGDFRSGLTTLLSTTIIQPLLRGSDSRIVLENLTQAERDTIYQIRTFNRFRQTFVISIITQYYQILQLHDALKNAQSNYDTRVTLCSRLEKLARVGRIPRFELDEARQDKLRAKDILIRTQKAYKQALDEFKIVVNLPTRAEFQLDENELEALTKAPLPVPDFAERDVVKTALIQRLDLANLGDAITDAERKIIVAADNLRAGLNLVAGSDTTSRQSTDISKSLHSIRGAGAVGLALDLPFDRVAEQTIYRKALIALNQRQREYEEAMRTVILEVRQAYRDMLEAAQRYQVQQKSLQLARKRYKNTLLLLQYGRDANTRDVLRAQDDLFDAQNAATFALIDYTVATLNFYRDAGVLQVRPDGMWERKTAPELVAHDR